MGAIKERAKKRRRGDNRNMAVLAFLIVAGAYLICGRQHVIGNPTAAQMESMRAECQRRTLQEVRP